MTQMPPLGLTQGLQHAARAIEAEEAAILAHQIYGLRGELVRLGGEKDANFRLQTPQGRFLLKVIAGEDPAVCDMHSRAMVHVAMRDPALPTQRVIRTLSGHLDAAVDLGQRDRRIVRLVSYVEGAMQRNTRATPTQRRNVGSMLARLQVALEDFRHPAEGHKLTWDMAHADDLIGPAERLPDGARLASALRDFSRLVMARIAELPQQAVHNDLNSDNVVVDPAQTDQVAGLIDFGDMVRTARVFDLAVGAAYQATSVDDPLEACCDVVSGFTRTRALMPAEIAGLFPTILARMAMRIVITEIRAELFPENRDYILRNTAQVRLQFDRLAQLDPGAAQARLSLSCT